MEAGKRPPKVQSSMRRESRQGSRLRVGLLALLVIPAAIAGLYALTSLGGKGGGSASSSSYPYVIGSPGPGQQAPSLNLPSTAGGRFDLAAYRGKSQVLLYFQEGLTCQPCWDQMVAIERELAMFKKLGINRIVSVTTDPLSLIQQKVADEGIQMPVASDEGAEVSTAWTTNRYQMQHMGERNGHTFILVGKDGRIRWRADYGGEPNYFMFVPTNVLLRQLRSALENSA